MTAESKPEQYLREIRDLHKENNLLLKKLSQYEDEKVSRTHWSTGFKIAGILLPYAFSMFVAWTFYAKVEDSIDTLKDFVVDIPSNISLSMGDNWESIKDGISEKGKNLWQDGSENSGEISDSVTQKWEDWKNKE